MHTHGHTVCPVQPLVVMSNVSSLLTVLAFGLTSSYTLAIVARLTGGLFNCTFLYALFCASMICCQGL